MSRFTKQIFHYVNQLWHTRILTLKTSTRDKCPGAYLIFQALRGGAYSRIYGISKIVLLPVTAIKGYRSQIIPNSIINEPYTCMDTKSKHK